MLLDKELMQQFREYHKLLRLRSADGEPIAQRLRKVRRLAMPAALSDRMLALSNIIGASADSYVRSFLCPLILRKLKGDMSELPRLMIQWKSDAEMRELRRDPHAYYQQSHCSPFIENIHGSHLQSGHGFTNQKCL